MSTATAFKLRVKAGRHAQDGPDGVPIMYGIGEVFENKENLARRWPEKFDEVDNLPDLPVSRGRTAAEAKSAVEVPQADPASTPPTNLAEYTARLEKMTVDQLRKHAEEEEIELKGAIAKADIIKVLRFAQ